MNEILTWAVKTIQFITVGLLMITLAIAIIITSPIHRIPTNMLRKLSSMLNMLDILDTTKDMMNSLNIGQINDEE